MIKNRKEAQIYLMDIRYKYSMNHFEEYFGDSVSYSVIEQESYIDLKDMVSEMVSDKIKFRKHERNNMILTLKVEMLPEEMEKFKCLLKDNKFRFLYDYEISNIRKN